MVPSHICKSPMLCGWMHTYTLSTQILAFEPFATPNASKLIGWRITVQIWPESAESNLSLFFFLNSSLMFCNASISLTEVKTEQKCPKNMQKWKTASW